jgi:hypothetical protein
MPPSSSVTVALSFIVALVTIGTCVAGESVAIVWEGGKPAGTVAVSHGELASARVVVGTGRAERDTFAFQSVGECRLELDIGDARLGEGSGATLVHVRTATNPFSFFLRDVDAKTPIVIPAYGVAVTRADDRQTYEELAARVGRGRRTVLEQIELEPEESYGDAAARTRSMQVPTWLGLGRDARIFEVRIGEPGQRDDVIAPKIAGTGVSIDEVKEGQLRYSFAIGRGRGSRDAVTRSLDEGVLPILHANVDEDDVQYRVTAFVTLETSPLTAETLRGTASIVADGFAAGPMFTPAQRQQFEAIRETELERDEEAVLWCRIEAVNSGAVPRYAWFKVPRPASVPAFDREAGFSLLNPERVCCVSRINGKACPQPELAVLVPPGGTAVYEFRLPHRPIPPARALVLAKQDFSQRLDECRRFWRAKLATAARLRLPEKRIDEMVRAGLLHLDLLCFGREPDGPLAALVGVYPPIGSESAPIALFMDSMGWHREAERILQHFLAKQHDDGMMQNFNGYMLETGAVLWAMGEHVRMTRDDDFVRRAKPQVLKACEFLIAWRERNKRDDLRAQGWGMIEGKVADPPDPYRVYMLNGYAFIGLSRAAEMLANVDPKASRRIHGEAEALKADIRTALRESMARSPVVPLGDGSWCPSAPPWAEATGPSMLFVTDDTCYTHGTFTVRDSILGPLHLAFQEVIAPDERETRFLLDAQAELMLQRNVGFSQPYYCRHDWVQLQRGMVKPFLKTYYNAVASLADRQTYTFNEHYFQASPHKTHEEAWFLMQTRWMLWRDEGDTLRLLSGIPRAWMKAGESIELDRASSSFGPFSLRVASQEDGAQVTAEVRCESNRRPAAVELRLPHPDRRAPATVTGGRYLPASETVRIEPFTGSATVRLSY